MRDKGISNDRVAFAQLMGMADHLSYSLGRAGYNVSLSSL